MLTAQDIILKNFGGQGGSAVEDAPTTSTLISENVQRWQPLVSSAIADTPGIDEDFALAVMQAESGGDPDAVSSAGASGLFQFTRETAKQYGVKNRRKPEEIIPAGVKKLSDLITRYGGDKKKALAAYNGGEAGVDQAVDKYGEAWLDNLHEFKGINKLTGKNHAEETRGYLERISSIVPLKKANAEDILKGLGLLGQEEAAPPPFDPELAKANLPDRGPEFPSYMAPEKPKQAVAANILESTGLIDKIEAAYGFTPEEPPSTLVAPGSEEQGPGYAKIAGKTVGKSYAELGRFAFEAGRIFPEGSALFYDAIGMVPGKPGEWGKKMAEGARQLSQESSEMGKQVSEFWDYTDDEQRAIEKGGIEAAAVVGVAQLAAFLPQILAGGGEVQGAKLLGGFARKYGKQALSEAAPLLQKAVTPEHAKMLGNILVGMEVEGAKGYAEGGLQEGAERAVSTGAMFAAGAGAGKAVEPFVKGASGIIRQAAHRTAQAGAFGGFTAVEGGRPEDIIVGAGIGAVLGGPGKQAGRQAKEAARVEPAAEKAMEPAKITDEDIALNKALRERILGNLKEKNRVEDMAELDRKAEEINKLEKQFQNEYIWTEGFSPEEGYYVKRGSPEEVQYRSELASREAELEALRRAGKDNSPFGVSKTVPRGDERSAVPKERAAETVETGTDGEAGAGTKYPEYLKTKQQRDDYDFLAKLPDEKYERLEDPTADLSDIDFTGAPEGIRQRIDVRREKNARAIESYNPENELRQELGKYGSDPLGEMNKELGRWDGLSDAEKIVKAEKLIENTPDEVLRTIGVEQDAGTGLFNENSMVNAINDYRSKIYSERSVENAARRKKAEEKRQSETPNLFRQEAKDVQPGAEKGKEKEVAFSEETGTLEGLADTRRPWEIEQARIEKERLEKRREEPLEGTVFDKNEMEARATEQGDLFAGEKPPDNVIPFPKREEGFESQVGAVGGEEPVRVKVTGNRPGTAEAEAMFKKQKQDVQEHYKKSFWDIFDEMAGKISDVSYGIKRRLRKDPKAQAKAVIMAYDKIKGANSEATAQLREAEKAIYSNLPRKYDELFGDFVQALRTIEVEGLKTSEGLPRNIKSTGGVKGSKLKDWLDDIKDHDPNGYAAMMDAEKKRIAVIFDQLDQLVSDGDITKKLADDLKANHKHYSLRKFIQHIDPETTSADASGNSVNVPDSGLKTLKEGSEQAMVNNPRYLLAEVIARTQSRIAKNRANQAMYKYIAENADNALGGKVSEGETPAFNREFTAWIDGEKKTFILPRKVAKYWVTADPQISKMTAAVLDWGLGGKILRPMATGYNPEFAIANLPRDMLHSWIATREYSSFLPVAIAQQVKDMIKVAPDVFGRKGRLRQYTKEGGGMEFLTQQGYVNRSRPWESPSVTGEQLRQAQGILGYLGESSEMLMRLAIRERAIKNGKTPEEATWIARNYIDFSQGGSMAKAVDRAVPYFNASIQATRGVVRGFSEDPKRATFQVAQLIALGAGLAIVNTQTRKEVWDEISEREKESKFIVALPWKYTDKNGSERRAYIGIAKDQGQRVFATIGEVLADRAMGNITGEVAFKRAKTALSDFIPVDAANILPPTVSAFIGYINNKDFWTHEPFWRGPDVKPTDEYWATTPQVYKDIGKATNLSPERLKGAITKVVTKNIYTDLVTAGWEEMTKGLSKEEREKLDKTALEHVSQMPGARRVIRVTNPKTKEVALQEEVKDVRLSGTRESLDRYNRAAEYLKKFKEKPARSAYSDYFRSEAALAREEGEKPNRASIKRTYDAAFANRFLKGRDLTIYKASTVAERRAMVEKTLDEMGLTGKKRDEERLRLMSKRSILRGGKVEEKKPMVF